MSTPLETTTTKGVCFRRESAWLTPDKRTKMIEERAEYVRRMTAALSPVQPGVEALLPSNEPYTVVFLGDIHLGSNAVDTEQFKKILKIIQEHKNMVILFTGDELEGENPSYKSIREGLIMNINEQLHVYKHYVVPLIDSGKVIGVLTKYHEHHGTWGAINGGLDFYYEIATEHDVAALQNKSILPVRTPDGKVTRIRTFHNIAKNGGSLAGNVRKENESTRTADVTISAHEHTRQAGSALEVKGRGKNPRRTTVIRGGAFKGQDGSLNDDSFMTQENGGATSAPPADSLLLTEYKGKQITLPLVNFAAVQVVTNAAVLFDKATREGAIEDLQHRIAKELESKPEVSMYPTKSTRPDTKKSAAISPYWELLHYDVHTQLPILVMLAAGYQAGSKYSNTPLLEETVDLVAKNPYARMIIGPQFIDRGIPMSEKRKATLQELIDHLQPLAAASTRDSLILAWLFDSVIENAQWKRPVKTGAGEYIEKDGVLPSNILSDALGARFIGGHGNVVMNLHNGERKKGKARYEFTIFDRNGTRTTFDPTQSLLSQITNDQFLIDMDEWQPTQRIAVGGQAPVGGFAHRWNQKLAGYDIYIAPGNYANRYKIGNGNNNIITPAYGGYGTVLWPDRRLAIPVSDLQRAEYFYAISHLFVGLSKLGLIDEYTKKLDKRKGKRS